MKPIDFAASDYQPITPANLHHTDIPADASTDLNILTVGGWGERNIGIIRISADGQPSAAPVRFLTGPQHHSHGAAVFELTLRKDSQLVFGVAQVSDAAVVRVSIDDEAVRDFSFSALPGAAGITGTKIGHAPGIYVADVNKDFTLPLPAGSHRVQIDLLAGDWVTLSHVTFTHALPLQYANLWATAVQDGKSKSALAWVLDTRSNWQQDLTGNTPLPDTDVTFTIPNLPDGSYQVMWFDTRRSQAIRAETVLAAGGRIVLRAPSFDRDVAVRITPAK